jgi:teichuronic acid biosynthesis glycosyltransferase TuaC
MSRINVLALSYLFPSSANRAYGIFVLNRLVAVSRIANVRVIAPVQWYPFMRLLRPSFWGSKVPREENISGLPTLHPRFAVIPRFMKWLDAITFLLAAGASARRWTRAGFSFDLIDVHWTYPDLVAGYHLAKRYGTGMVVTVRGHEALYEDERTVRRWLVRRYLRRANLVVTLSDELRDRVVALGVDRKRVLTILNGVDRGTFSFADKLDSRRALGLPTEERILVSVGRLTEGKGHHHLIRMLPVLAQRGPIRLYLIGGVNAESDYGTVLRKLVSDLALTNVHFIDRVPHDDLRLWYGAADLFCLATRSEGCPNVVLEALSCGTPVVVTDVGAIDAIVRSGVNGLLVPRNEAGAIGATVAAALEHSWDRERISADMDQWGWESCADQVVQCYRAVMDERA